MLEHLKATEPADEISAALESDGAVIVEGVLDDDVMARLTEEVEPHLARSEEQARNQSPEAARFFGAMRHVAALVAKSPTFATEVITHPVFLDVCDRVLLKACSAYLLNIGHLLVRGPGAEHQRLHRDEIVWVHLPSPHLEIMVSSITALIDFSAENGATRVVPGSHRWDKSRRATPKEIVDAEMPGGSTVLYLGSTLHGAGANATADTWRPGISMSYVAGWLRTEENLFLSAPPKLVRGLPRRAQELLGYVMHNAAEAGGAGCGTYEMGDPIDALFGEE